MAKRAASGWNMATPMPLTSAARKSSGNGCTTPIAATPPPASSSPRQISHGIERRSASSPMAGWMTDEDMAWASTSVPAVSCERWRCTIR